jgi:hypothetical protein
MIADQFLHVAQLASAAYFERVTDEVHALQQLEAPHGLSSGTI